jgi:hypothetical protein
MFPLGRHKRKPNNLAVTNTAASNRKLADEFDMAAVGSTKFLGSEKETFAAGTHEVEMWCEARGPNLSIVPLNILAWSTG